MRLERGLHVGGRLAGQLDAGVGRREGGVGVSADDLPRLLGEALLRQPLVEEKRRPFLELERQCDQARFGCVRRVRGDGGDGLARPGRLGRQRRVATHRERPFGPSTALTPGVRRAASRSIETTRQRETGARSTLAWSMPGSATSTV